MRKKLLTVLITGLFTSQVLAGCGSSTEPDPEEGGVVNVPTDAPDTAETPEDAVLPTATPTEEPVPEPPVDWLQEHDIEITPQGDFTYVTTNHNAEIFEAVSSAVITETTEGVEEGYKQVICTFVNDFANSDAGYRFWSSAFDRYTGTSFEFDSETTYTDFGQSSNKAGFVTIVNGDVSYDVSITFETVNEDPQITKTITVTCPVDYDGVVFQIGYSDEALAEANGAIDYTARLYTIDELPAYGDGYYYFSYSNE